jgi:hypothetical protein
VVSDGYWLAAPGHDWRRVKLEDYLTAAGNAGLYRTVTDRPPEAFTDIASGIRGTTSDPNADPQEIPRLHVQGRTLNEQQLAALRTAWGQVGAVLAQVRADTIAAMRVVAEAMGAAVDEAQKVREAATIRNQPCTAAPDDVLRRVCYVWTTHEHPDLPGVQVETCMRCGEPNWEALAKLLQ